jgi:hypothetical protein
MIQVIDVVVDVGGRNEIFIGNSNSRYGPLTLFFSHFERISSFAASGII